jgi:hypothetical protein
MITARRLVRELSQSATQCVNRSIADKLRAPALTAPGFRLVQSRAPAAPIFGLHRYLLSPLRVGAAESLVCTKPCFALGYRSWRNFARSFAVHAGVRALRT